jgi:hypothetical protein
MTSSRSRAPRSATRCRPSVPNRMPVRFFRGSAAHNALAAEAAQGWALRGAGRAGTADGRQRSSAASHSGLQHLADDARYSCPPATFAAQVRAGIARVISAGATRLLGVEDRGEVDVDVPRRRLEQTRQVTRRPHGNEVTARITGRSGPAASRRSARPPNARPTTLQPPSRAEGAAPELAALPCAAPIHQEAALAGPTAAPLWRYQSLAGSRRRHRIG